MGLSAELWSYSSFSMRGQQSWGLLQMHPAPTFQSLLMDSREASVTVCTYVHVCKTVPSALEAPLHVTGCPSGAQMRACLWFYTTATGTGLGTCK